VITRGINPLSFSALDLVLVRACPVTSFVYRALAAGFRTIRAFFSYIVVCAFCADFIVLAHSYNIIVALAPKTSDYTKFRVEVDISF
jgi:hypothetical protein